MPSGVKSILLKNLHPSIFQPAIIIIIEQEA